MKVVLDCRSVFPGMGGIGRATAELARHLPAHLPHDELVLLTGARAPGEPLAEAPNVTVVPVDAAMIDSRFEQVRLPSLLDALEADVYHNPCFAVPIVGGQVARVATVHDVVFRRHPELVDRRLREYLDRWTHVSCELAEVVVTVSQFSRRELQAVYGCPPERIEVIPNAVDERFFGVARRAPLGAPFVLYVGSIEPKKNVQVLIDAFDRLRALDPSLPHQLVLVGGLGGADMDLEAVLERVPESRGRVHVLGRVSDAALLELYAAADLFCYLSQYEGFGLPPLEAMAVGVPTIVSDRASLPEVVRDAAVIVDPDEPEQVARAMRGLLTQPGRAATYARHGKARAHQFSWARAARQLATAYRVAMSRVSANTEPGADEDDGARPGLHLLRGRDA